ncbi:MAG: penicillin-binding protein activator [Pseudomonadota bacterium]|nr:penicillin-binding protein activator [Pseudomonadota bacterium]
MYIKLKSNRSILISNLAISLATFILSACSVDTLQNSIQQPEGVQKAITLSQRGDHLAASQQYELLASTSNDPQKQRYILFSAQELYLANQFTSAERKISDFGDNVANSNLALWAEVLANIYLAQEKPGVALNVLNRVINAPTRQGAIRILQLRAYTLFQLGRQQAAVTALVRRENLLDRLNDRNQNHQLIWENLERSEKPITNLSIESATDPVVGGWLSLAQINNKNRGSIGLLRQSLIEWQEKNPEHPANINLLPELLSNLAALSNYPSNVAVLLPLSGSKVLKGEAIRDGYLTAVYSLTEANARPNIRFYDTEKSSVSNIYKSAIDNGATFIVGPLLKERVNEIAYKAKSISTLTLNYATISDINSDKLYQFSLAPEDEARSIARRAISEGLRNAVALIPESSWGKRIYEAFQNELLQYGGQILKAENYPTNETDFSQVITSALLIKESDARRNSLANLIGKKLQYEPRRREDVDFIFLASQKPKEAQQLRPQLKKNYANDLPTFTNSDAYNPGSEFNEDLDGVIFPDAPWLINPTITIEKQKQALKDIWGNNFEEQARFFAMGYDAYQLTTLLNGKSGSFKLSLKGMTGEIFMDQGGLLHRNMDFARIKKGRPQLISQPSESIELPLVDDISLDKKLNSELEDGSTISIISPNEI